MPAGREALVYGDRNDMILASCSAAAVTLLLLAAATDLAARVVPNRLCLALGAVGIVLRLGAHAGPHTLAASFLAGLAVFVPAMICWRHGVMGGGDVKLLGAATLLVQPAAVPGLVLAVATTGGLLGVAYWVLARLVTTETPDRPKGLVRRVLRIERHRIRRHFSVPYAIAISGGTIYVLGGELMP